MTATPQAAPRADAGTVSLRAPNSPGTTARDAQNLLGPFSRLLSPPLQQFLQQLTQTNVLPAGAVKDFLQFHGDRVGEWTSEEKLGRALVTAGLLTNYQLERIVSGAIHGLMLGNYRVLERLGGGS